MMRDHMRIPLAPLCAVKASFPPLYPALIALVSHSDSKDQWYVVRELHIRMKHFVCETAHNAIARSCDILSF
jgi:hypothetical protein